jgi:hypothetical protein
MFLISTGALATIAAAGSTIVPVIVPRSLCANAAEEKTADKTTNDIKRIDNLPLKSDVSGDSLHGACHGVNGLFRRYPVIFGDNSVGFEKTYVIGAIK